MSSKPKDKISITVNNLTRSDILRIAKKNKQAKMNSLSTAIRHAGTVGVINEPISIGSYQY